MNYANTPPEEITLVDSGMSPSEVLRYIAQTAVMMGEGYMELYHYLREDVGRANEGYMVAADNMSGWAVDFYTKYVRNYDANDHETPWHKDYPDADCWDDAVDCYCWDRIKAELGPKLAETKEFSVFKREGKQYDIDLETTTPKELRKLFNI